MGNCRILLGTGQYILGAAFLFLLIFSSVGFASTAHAKSAQIMISPVRIIMEPNERYATLTIKNVGDATGRYRISMLDSIMQENGAINLLPAKEYSKYSARKMLRISPRSSTLKPQEYQNIRILARRKKNMEDGEYRSHLRITQINSNVSALPSYEDPQNDAQQFSISVTPRVSTVIPVIVRQGKDLNPSFTITDVKILNEKDDQKNLRFTLNSTNNVSTSGNIQVDYTSPEGEKTTLIESYSVVVYRETTKRVILLSIKNPTALSFTRGKLSIFYTKKDDKDKVFASQVIVL